MKLSLELWQRDFAAFVRLRAFGAGRQKPNLCYVPGFFHVYNSIFYETAWFAIRIASGSEGSQRGLLG